MRKSILCIASLLMLVSCNNFKDGEYKISGEIEGVKTGKIFLERQSETGFGFQSIDTVKITDGKFEIVGKTKEPELCFIQIEKIEGKVPFILEEGGIDIIVDKDSLYKSTIGGTYSNDEFNNFNKESNKIKKGLQKKVMDFQMKNMAKLNEAQKNNDTITLNKLRNDYRALQKDMNDYMFGYPDKHPDSYISLLITQEMLRNPDFKVTQIEKTFNSLNDELKKTKFGKKLQDQLKEIQRKDKEITKQIGKEKAPDFSAKTPDGKVVSLKQSMGKVTIVDFWASWCGPCRKENPNVVQLYNELHPKGLNIIGVSLDENVEKWKEAIATDKLTWTQISNLKGWQDPIAKLYNIEQIPSTLVLDANGMIVARDLRGNDLKNKVKELLNLK